MIKTIPFTMKTTFLCENIPRKILFYSFFVLILWTNLFKVSWIITSLMNIHVATFTNCTWSLKTREFFVLILCSISWLVSEQILFFFGIFLNLVLVCLLTFHCLLSASNHIDHASLVMFMYNLHFHSCHIQNCVTYLS